MKPRTLLTEGDKCIWPLSFLKYAVDQSGVTFALRRIPPLLGVRAASSMTTMRVEDIEQGETKKMDETKYIAIPAVHQGRQRTLLISRKATATDLQLKIEETFGVIPSNQSFPKLKKKQRL